jgi:phosphohistidine phosphatase
LVIEKRYGRLQEEIMLLLFIRHAIAAPLGGANDLDQDRPLTPRGKRRFRQVSRQLVRLLPRPKAILTSPYLRARQTADIAATAWGDLTPVPLPALRKGKWSGIRRELSNYCETDIVVLIGHEDWISQLTARLLGSERGNAFGYRKGGIALIELTNLNEESAVLRWFIPPRVFRGLR